MKKDCNNILTWWWRLLRYKGSMYISTQNNGVSKIYSLWARSLYIEKDAHTQWPSIIFTKQIANYTNIPSFNSTGVVNTTHCTIHSPYNGVHVKIRGKTHNRRYSFFQKTISLYTNTRDPSYINVNSFYSFSFHQAREMIWLPKF